MVNQARMNRVAFIFIRRSKTACKDAKTVHVRKSALPEPRQQKMYNALEIDLYPGPVITNYFLNKSSAMTRNFEFVFIIVTKKYDMES